MASSGGTGVADPVRFRIRGDLCGGHDAVPKSRRPAAIAAIAAPSGACAGNLSNDLQ